MILEVKNSTCAPQPLPVLPPTALPHLPSLKPQWRALLVLRVGSQEVVRGRITIGQFVAFNAYLVMLSWPMIAFGWVTNMLQRGMASWKRMLEVLDTTPAIADAAGHMHDIARGMLARGTAQRRTKRHALQRVDMSRVALDVGEQGDVVAGLEVLVVVRRTTRATRAPPRSCRS